MDNYSFKIPLKGNIDDIIEDIRYILYKRSLEYVGDKSCNKVKITILGGSNEKYFVKYSGNVKRITPEDLSVDESELYEYLKRWRLSKSYESGCPAYVIILNDGLAAIAKSKPNSKIDMLGYYGYSWAFIERNGDELIELINGYLGR